MQQLRDGPEYSTVCTTAGFLPTWRRTTEAAATEIRPMPAAMAAVFSAPSDDEPAVPELIALSAT